MKRQDKIEVIKEWFGCRKFIKKIKITAEEVSGVKMEKELNICDLCQEQKECIVISHRHYRYTYICRVCLTKLLKEFL